MMFTDKKPEQTSTIGSIDPQCDVLSILEGKPLFPSYLIFFQNIFTMRIKNVQTHTTMPNFCVINTTWSRPILNTIPRM